MQWSQLKCRERRTFSKLFLQDAQPWRSSRDGKWRPFGVAETARPEKNGRWLAQVSDQSCWTKCWEKNFFVSTLTTISNNLNWYQYHIYSTMISKPSYSFILILISKLFKYKLLFFSIFILCYFIRLIKYIFSNLFK